MCHSYSGRASARDLLRQLRLARAGLALDEERPREGYGGVHRHHEVVGGDVAVGTGETLQIAHRPPV
jgi:hypothetical protein